MTAIGLGKLDADTRVRIEYAVLEVFAQQVSSPGPHRDRARRQRELADHLQVLRQQGAAAVRQPRRLDSTSSRRA
jgi:hypothetical protein